VIFGLDFSDRPGALNFTYKRESIQPNHHAHPVFHLTRFKPVVSTQPIMFQLSEESKVRKCDIIAFESTN
jgi:hypothetical protein